LKAVNVIGPLHGIKVVEIAGIGPAPFCAMMLADFGAEVIRIDRAPGAGLGIPVDPLRDVLNRGKRSIMLDLKSVRGRETALALIARSDAGFVSGTVCSPWGCSESVSPPTGLICLGVPTDSTHIRRWPFL
jgi:hypothetical protein